MTKEVELNKNTINDKRRMLSEAVEGWLVDFDDDYIFVERYAEDGESYREKTFKTSYSITEGNKVVLGEDATEVVKLTEYSEVTEAEEPITKSWIETNLASFIDKYFGNKDSKPDVNIIKQFGEESGELYAVEPLYLAPGEVDGHGDTIDLETIENMVDSLNKANDEGRLQSGLFHKHKTNSWRLDKAWVNPHKCKIGDEVIPAGQPIAKTIFTNPVMHQMRVDGDILGLSIGAKGVRVPLDKSAEELKSLQDKPEAQHILKDVHFDWDYPELTYTSPSQGGAASLKNEIFDISKAKKATKQDLDKDQEAILEALGEEFISLEKHLGVDNNQTPSSSEVTEGLESGEETKLEKGTEDMSDDILKELAALRHENAVIKLEKQLAGFELPEEIAADLADTMAGLKEEGQSAVNKALTAILEAGQSELEKAKAESTKAAPEVSEGTKDLQKALGEESGEAGEPETSVEKTLLEKIMAHQEGDK